MFERFGRVTRVFLAKDRETNMAKGFAFISFQDRADAARACEKMDGCKLACIKFLAWLILRSWISAFNPSRRICEENDMIRWIVQGFVLGEDVQIVLSTV